MRYLIFFRFNYYTEFWDLDDLFMKWLVLWFNFSFIKYFDFFKKHNIELFYIMAYYFLEQWVTFSQISHLLALLFKRKKNKII